MITDKRKKRKPVRLNEHELVDLAGNLAEGGLPEGIFGVLDESLNLQERISKKSRKPSVVKPRRPNVLPNIPITKPGLPKEAKGIEFSNVVSVPEELLRRITHSIDVNTAKVNSLLLEKLIPMLLSYDTGTAYAKAALRDGLNVEIDFDAGLEEAIKHIGYLNVIFHYIKQSRLPTSVKRRFMHTFSDGLANTMLSALVETNKIQDRQKLSQDLQAVVYSGRNKKTTVHRVEDSKAEESRIKEQSPVVVRRRKT